MASAAELKMRDYVSGASAPPTPDYTPCWSGDPALAPSGVPACKAKSMWEKLKEKIGIPTYDSVEAWKKDNPDMHVDPNGGCEGWNSTPLECIKAKGLNVIFVLGGIAIVGAFVFSAVKGKA